MNPDLYIRHASKDDLPDILEIYRPFVEDTSITFEYITPLLSDFALRYEGVTRYFPWLVCEYDGIIVGYAYATWHQERAAYQWDAELSIYLRPEYYGRRIGTALYRSLMRTLTLQGFLYAHASITLPNDKSIKFHKHLGFKTICIFEKTGFKLDSWHDVAELRTVLAELPDNPTKPEAYHELNPYVLVRIFKEEAANVLFP